MFIDYVPLMLINMAAGLVLLAGYVHKGIDSSDQKKWAAGFLMSGLVALICGLHMSWNWPLPGSYNVAFGELSVLLGVLFLGAGLSLSKGWSLFSVALYGLFSGITAVVVGVRIINLKMTLEPLLSGMGFILTGSSGILILPAIHLKHNRGLRILIGFLLIIAAIIWLVTGYKAYWGHLASLAEWKPLLMR